MQNGELVEVNRSYTFTCTLCNAITTTRIEHECQIGYGLGQIRSDMDPQYLCNEVFWNPPDENLNQNIIEDQDDDEELDFDSLFSFTPSITQAFSVGTSSTGTVTPSGY